MSTTHTQAANAKRRADDARGTPPGAGTIEPSHGGRIGNPPHVPTEETRARVRVLAQSISEYANHLIAADIGISRQTLDRYYKGDIDRGRAGMVAAAGAQLISKALRGDDAVGPDGKLLAPGNLEALKFLLARRGGWTTKVEMTGRDGRPVETVDLSNMTVEALREYGRQAAIQAGLDPDEAVGPADA